MSDWTGPAEGPRAGNGVSHGAAGDGPHLTGDDRDGGALTVEVARDGDDLVLSVRGELDLTTAPLLDKALHEITEPPRGRAVVELSKLDFVDVAGLRALIVSCRRLTPPGRRLTVRRPSPLTRRVLELTDLSDWVLIEP